ncbi:MAG: hypothetical protein JNJ98_16910 [Gemmatimonadetes bacterium]|nr:hypothetical protein [Gemmatimonadota bacterium]
MSFFGNFAELTTQLTIFKGTQEVASLSQVRTAKGLLPIYSRLTDEFSRDVGQACGHMAEVVGSGAIELRAIPVSGGQTVIIAGVRDDARADARQPDCAPRPGSGNPYDDQCQFCLEWTWYIGNTEVDKTYQCSPAMSCPAQ